MRGPLGKLDSTWSKGMYLGVRGLSDERIIGTPEDIFKTRTTQRVPMEERWTAEAAGMVGGVPWLLSGTDEKADGEALQSEGLKPMSEELQEEVKAKAPAPRRAGLKKEGFKDHGTPQIALGVRQYC